MLILRISFNSKFHSVFSATLGLPCSHELELIQRSVNRLSITHINEHWWIHGRQPIPPLAKPVGNCIDVQPLQFLKESDTGTPENDYRKVSTIENALDQVRKASENWTAVEKSAHLRTLQSIVEQPSIIVLDPIRRVGKGRPVGALNKKRKLIPASSTKREPSGFEYVESLKKERLCSICKKKGHNSRRCSQKKVCAFYSFQMGFIPVLSLGNDLTGS